MTPAINSDGVIQNKHNMNCDCTKVTVVNKEEGDDVEAALMQFYNQKSRKENVCFQKQIYEMGGSNYSLLSTAGEYK